MQIWSRPPRGQPKRSARTKSARSSPQRGSLGTAHIQAAACRVISNVCGRKWHAGTAPAVARRDAAVKFQHQTTEGQLQQHHCEQRGRPSPHNGLSCCSSDLHLNSRMLTPPSVSSHLCYLVMAAQPSQRKCVKGSKGRSIKEPSRVKMSQQAQPCSGVCDQHPTHTPKQSRPPPLLLPARAGSPSAPRPRCSAAQVGDACQPACPALPAALQACSVAAPACLLALLRVHARACSTLGSSQCTAVHSTTGQPSRALPQKEATPAIGPLMRLASCMSLGTAGHTHEPQQQPSTAVARSAKSMVRRNTARLAYVLVVRAGGADVVRRWCMMLLPVPGTPRSRPCVQVAFTRCSTKRMPAC